MKPKQFFFVMIGIMAVLAGGGGAGYYYAHQYLNEQSAVYSTKLAEQQEAQKQIDELGSLQAQYDHSIVPILPLIDESLPRDKKQTEILAQIERIATDVGVIQPFDSVIMPAPLGLPSDVSQTSKSGQVLALPITFTAKGTTQQLQTFTARLEALNRYTDVTTLGIKHDVKKDANAYTFTLNAYIMP